jgi:murein biosynthesis integral membrane protein MurJ
VLNIGLLLGRFLGFIRESFVAATYGTSSQADIVILMLTIPDLLVNLLAGGAMGAILIPEFTSRSQDAKKILYQAMAFFGAIFLIITTIFFLYSYDLVKLLAPGFSTVQVLSASINVEKVIWLIPLTILAGITTAYLQSNNIFFLPSLGTAIINSSIIVGLLLIYLGYGDLSLLAISVLIGGGLRFISQLLATRIHWNPKSSFKNFLLNKDMFIRYGQALLSASALLFIPVLAKAFASYNDSGSIAIMNYSTRLVEFPLTIAITFLAIILFPRFSKSFKNDKSLHKRLVKYGIQVTLSVSFMITIVLLMISDSYVDIVFNHGVMGDDELIIVENLIKIGLLSIPMQGLAIILTAIYHSQKNTKIPLLSNIVSLALFIVAYISNIFGVGLEAIMLSMLVAYGLTCILQIYFLKVDGLKLLPFVLLDKELILGLPLSLIILIFSVKMIVDIGLPPFGVLSLSGLVFLISVLILSLFYKDIRSIIRDKLL